MKRFFIYPVLVVIILITTTSFTVSNLSPCYEVINKMIKSIAEIKTLRYNLTLVERTSKKYNNFASSVKLQRVPRKIYINANGVEVLWVEGKYEGDALINPNSFPYINLFLDPNGSLMRQDQHHTINEIGFDYLGKVIDANAKRLENKFDEHFKLEPDEIVNGRLCHKVVINNSDFSYVDYVVQKGENLVTIARKLFVSEYMILRVNQPKVSDYKDVKAGQVIKVPNSYAKNVILFIDKQIFLPVGSRIYDDKGLYEQYDYHSLLVNPHIDDAEFTKDYKGYGF